MLDITSPKIHNMPHNAYISQPATVPIDESLVTSATVQHKATCRITTVTDVRK